jgi:hypothetical protein
MHRKATSPEEFAQVARVHALLCGVNVVQSPQLAVTIASGQTHTGQFVQLQIRNTATRKGGCACHGVITLATPEGELNINYLDVVSLQSARP